MGHVFLLQLIRENRPDLVLFVGEALVGNEAVDQLSRFNQALVDYSNEQDLRAIDGIVLTKFDTIDDKVCTCTHTRTHTLTHSLLGWCCHLNDIHHWPAHCVCGHRAKVR